MRGDHPPFNFDVPIYTLTTCLIDRVKTCLDNVNLDKRKYMCEQLQKLGTCCYKSGEISHQTSRSAATTTIPIQLLSRQIVVVMVVKFSNSKTHITQCISSGAQYVRSDPAKVLLTSKFNYLLFSRPSYKIETPNRWGHYYYPYYLFRFGRNYIIF